MPDLVSFLFGFQGRVRRRDFWIFFLILGVIYGGLFWQLGHFHVEGGLKSGIIDWNNPGHYGITWISNNPLISVFGLVAIWMKLAVLVKRWHDRDKSGWMVLIMLIPLIGWLWQLIETGFLDGTQGPNRFGPSPKT